MSGSLDSGGMVALARWYGRAKAGRYRKGDVRHCYADVQRADRLLNFKAKVSLKEGLRELAEWAKLNRRGNTGLFQKALEQLEERELMSR